MNTDPRVESLRASVHERLEFLRGPGGIAATAYWALKSLLRIDVHGFFAFALRSDPAPLRDGFRFIALRREADLLEVPDDMLNTLDGQSGAGVRALLARGAHVYALAAANTIACQTNISMRSLSVDSPLPLQIQLTARDTFLGFLYTYPRFRRCGLGESLLRLVCHSLAEQGYERCICHIRMTNVPSLAAFRRTGWQRTAWLISTTGGRFLGAPGAARAGIRLSPEPGRRSNNRDA